eukprot:173927-Prymnesium_polylepis.1
MTRPPFTIVLFINAHPLSTNENRRGSKGSRTTVRNTRYTEPRWGTTSTTVTTRPSWYVTTSGDFPEGLRYVNGGKSTSSSPGKAESHWSDAPRPMNESVRSFNRRACAVASSRRYMSATLSSAVVDIGAISVPPCCAKSSLSVRSRMPRHRSKSACALDCAALTARSLPIASLRNVMVTGNGCGRSPHGWRSGPLRTLYAAVV